MRVLTPFAYDFVLILVVLLEPATCPCPVSVAVPDPPWLLGIRY